MHFYISLPKYDPPPCPFYKPAMKLHLQSESRCCILLKCILLNVYLSCWCPFSVLVIQDSPLAKLQKLDLSYNHRISDQGWATFYQGVGALEQLSELDVSLRPTSRRDCGEWFDELLAALPKLPILLELDLQGWILSKHQQKQLESFNWGNERNIHVNS